MPNNSSTIILDARDNASGAIRNVENNLDSLENAVQGTGTSFTQFNGLLDQYGNALASASGSAELFQNQNQANAKSLGVIDSALTKTSGSLNKFGNQNERVRFVVDSLGNRLTKNATEFRAAQSTIERYNLANSRIAASAAQAETAIESLGRGTAQSSIIQTRFAGQVRKNSSELDRLWRSASQGINIVTQTNAAISKSAATMGAAASQTSRLRRSLSSLSAGYELARKAGNKNANVMNVSSFNTANLAAQFNDIGVTLAAGQSPFLIALQQGTQVSQVLQLMSKDVGVLRALFAGLKSVISPISLITIGVIAAGAALGQWAISAFKASRETRDFEEILEELSTAVGNYSSLVDKTSQSNFQLAQTYGSLRDEARSFLEVQQELSRATVLTEIGAAVNSLSQSFDDLAGFDIPGLFDGRFGGDSNARLQARFGFEGAEEVREQFEEFRILYAQLQQVGESGNLDEAASDLDEFINNVVKGLGPLGDWTDEQRELVQGLTELQDNVIRAANAQEEYNRSLERRPNLVHPDFDPANAVLEEVRQQQLSAEAEFADNLADIRQDVVNSITVHPDFDPVEGVLNQIRDRQIAEEEQFASELGEIREHVISSLAHPDFDPVEEVLNEIRERQVAEEEKFAEQLAEAREEVLAAITVHPDFDPVEQAIADIRARQLAEEQAFAEELAAIRESTLSSLFHPDFDPVEQAFDQIRQRQLAEEEEFNAQLEALQEEQNAIRERAAQKQLQIERERATAVEAVRTATLSETDQIREQISQLDALFAANANVTSGKDELILSTEIYTQRLHDLNFALLDSTGYFETLSAELDMTRTAFEAIEDRHSSFRQSIEADLLTPIQKAEQEIAELTQVINEAPDGVETFERGLQELNAELENLQRQEATTEAINNLKQSFNEGEISAATYKTELEVLENQLKAVAGGDSEVVLTVESERALRDLETFEKIWQDSVQNMQKEFSDTIYNALFEEGISSFKDFGDAIVDIWKRALANMIAAYAASGFTKLFGNLLGGGGGLGGGSLLGSTLGSVLGGGTAGGGGGFGGLGGIGSIGSSIFGSIGAITPGLGAIGGSGFLGGAAAAFSPGGFGAFNIGANATLAGGGFGATLGAALPALAAVTFAIAAFTSKTKILDEGLRATVNETDVLVQQFQEIKKSRLFGLISSRRTNLSDAPAGVQDAFQGAVTNIADTTAGILNLFGLPTGLEGFSKEFEVSLKGLDDAAKEAAINELLGEIGASMQQFSLGALGFIVDVDQAATAFGKLTEAAGLVAAASEQAFNVAVGRINAESQLVNQLSSLTFGELDALAQAAKERLGGADADLRGGLGPTEFRRTQIEQEIGTSEVGIEDAEEQIRNLRANISSAQEALKGDNLTDELIAGYQSQIESYNENIKNYQDAINRYSESIAALETQLLVEFAEIEEEVSQKVFDAIGEEINRRAGNISVNDVISDLLADSGIYIQGINDAAAAAIAATDEAFEYLRQATLENGRQYSNLFREVADQFIAQATEHIQRLVDPDTYRLAFFQDDPEGEGFGRLIQSQQVPEDGSGVPDFLGETLAELRVSNEETGEDQLEKLEELVDWSNRIVERIQEGNVEIVATQQEGNALLASVISSLQTQITSVSAGLESVRRSIEDQERRTVDRQEAAA